MKQPEFSNATLVIRGLFGRRLLDAPFQVYINETPGFTFLDVKSGVNYATCWTIKVCCGMDGTRTIHCILFIFSSLKGSLCLCKQNETKDRLSSDDAQTAFF